MEKLTDEQIKKMNAEAEYWMKAMNVNEDVVADFSSHGKIHKVFVNHEEKRLRNDELTEEELENVRTVEEQQNILVYYVIQDQGVWPDGVTFPRYTYLYISRFEDDWKLYRNELGTSGYIPAYVINEEEPDCSEDTEIAFRNVKGMIISAS